MSLMELENLLQFIGQLGLSSSSARCITRATWMWVALWKCLEVLFYLLNVNCSSHGLLQCHSFILHCYGRCQPKFQILCGWFSVRLISYGRLTFRKCNRQNSNYGNKRNIFSLLAASFLWLFDLFQGQLNASEELEWLQINFVIVH